MTYLAKQSGSGLIAFLAGIAVWAIFGDKIKQKVNEKLEEKEEWKASYDKMVDDTMDKYAKIKGISKNELTDLADELKVHWKKIKIAWNKGGDNL